MPIGIKDNGYLASKLERFDYYASGDASGTDEAQTHALSILSTSILGVFMDHIAELEDRIAALENPDWGAYQHAKPTPERDPWPGF